MNNKISLIHVTTVPEAYNFFRGQIAFMKKRGFEIHAVSSQEDFLQIVGEREQIPVHGIIKSPRTISPFQDLLNIWKLYRLFKAIRPTIVHAHMPKGGLLGVMAAKLAGVPVVMYTLRGLRYATASGWQRKLLIWSEKVTCAWADHVVAVSSAIRNCIVEAGYCRGDKIFVLANGSSNGVDAQGRYNPDLVPPQAREKIRQQYNIPEHAVVIGFLGRIVSDKGIKELYGAWKNLREQFSDLYLVLIGRFEPQDPVPEEVVQELKNDPRVIITGWITDSIPMYASLDILTLPTYREGFPNTPLEGAAMQLPVVTTTVDGCPEATLDGVTGLLVPPRDSQALASALSRLITDAQLRRQMGEAGRKRVLQYFRPEMIWQALYETYLQLLRRKHIDTGSVFTPDTPGGHS